jgi:transcriptional regulator with XRE-family HTH domain
MLKLSFGERLRAARQVKGLTLKEAADAAGISEPYLSLIENGRRKPRKLSVLKAVCRTVAQGRQYNDLLDCATTFILSQ